MPEAYEALFEIGQPKGKRDEEWKIITWKPNGDPDIMVSTLGRVATELKNKPHFGTFENDRKYGRIRMNGKMQNVLKLCKKHFPPEKWDFVDPFWDKQGPSSANLAPNK